MGSLLFSISGLRGIVGLGLTPEIITEYAAGYGSFLNGGKVVVGRDTRISGDMIKHAVLAGLLSSGCEVLDLGVVPTPTVNLMVREAHANGGIAITASHNPIEWNALKFINNEGIFLDGQEAQDFLEFLRKGEFRRVGWEEIKKIDNLDQAIEIHIDKILNSKIGKNHLKKLKVGIDAVNGAGSVAIPRLLKKLGMDVYPIHCTPDGNFPRPPEPLDENLEALKKNVREKRLDLGFAVDPDSDRLAIIDEQGNAIGEEKTLVLASKYILTKNKGPIVTNLSTTRLIDDIAKLFEVPLFRTKVGEANVVKKMREVAAVVGGEGNGGVILPELNFTRDALVAITLVINLLSQEKKKVSEICKELPQYFMIKRKIIVKDWLDRKEKIMKFVTEHRFLQNATVDRVDGFKFISQDIWIHIRLSQTEPIIRIISEGEDFEKVKQLVEEVEGLCVA